MQDLIQFANDRPTALNDDLYQWAVDAEEHIRSLVADCSVLLERRTALEDKITELTSEEHSLPELRQMLDENYEEKKKCYFAISQYQKANKNLIEELKAANEDLVKHRELMLTHLAVVDPLRAENERLQLQSKERGSLAISNGIRMERAEEAHIQQAAINALLRAERDAFIKDKQRLDWFNTGEGVFRVANTWYYKTSYFKPAKRQKDIRAAIDAGMKYEGKDK
jgi:DNA repair exonuclease SbcCD ATPase subunit